MEYSIEFCACTSYVEAQLGNAVHEAIEVGVEPEETTIPHADDVVGAV